MEKLTESGQRFAMTMRPLEALRAWMFLFLEYVACKLLILPAMDTVPGGSTRMIEGTRGVSHSAFRGLAQRAIESGDLRAGTDPDDVIRAFVGVFRTTSLPGWESSARRIVDILIDGSRPRWAAQPVREQSRHLLSRLRRVWDSYATTLEEVILTGKFPIHSDRVPLATSVPPSD